MKPLHFAYNPTSWADGPIPGGMADRLVQPILPHLTTPFTVGPTPIADAVNVYLTFPHTYGLHGPVPGETAVFVSHGIADKGWRNHRKVRTFDYVFVSGPDWSRRMLLDGYPAAQTIEAGYTKLDPLFNRQVESPWPDRDGRVRVVYAPTHGGGGEKFADATRGPGGGPRRTSYWDRDLILDNLPADWFDVKVAFHPRHRPDRRATLEEYQGADVVIADGGSTIYEAWALGLPVVFPSWLTSQANIAKSTPGSPTFEGLIYTDRLGYHADHASDLPAVVKAAADSGILPGDQAFIERILPGAYRGRSGEMHAQALEDICAGRAVRHRIEVEHTTYQHIASGRTREIPKFADAGRYERSPRWRKVDEVNA